MEETRKMLEDAWGKGTCGEQGNSVMQPWPINDHEVWKQQHLALRREAMRPIGD